MSYKVDPDMQGEMVVTINAVIETMGNELREISQRVANATQGEVSEYDMEFYQVCALFCAIIEDPRISEDAKAYALSGFAEKLEGYLNTCPQDLED